MSAALASWAAPLMNVCTVRAVFRAAVLAVEKRKRAGRGPCQTDWSREQLADDFGLCIRGCSALFVHGGVVVRRSPPDFGEFYAGSPS